MSFFLTCLCIIASPEELVSERSFVSGQTKGKGRELQGGGEAVESHGVWRRVALQSFKGGRRRFDLDSFGWMLKGDEAEAGEKEWGTAN